MREKERIDRILSLMNQIWSKYPDMRFNQLIDALSWDFVIVKFLVVILIFLFSF